MQSTGQTSTHAVSFVPMQGSVMMYAKLMSSKAARRDSQPRSITRAFALLALLVCTDLRPAAQPNGAPSAAWREAPEYVSLFSPPAHRAAYRAYVSPQGLEATLKQLDADPAILRPPGAWTPQAMIPYDAFGLTGSYNRWKVAGLYRSRRARVARGPRIDQGATESWTLIEPFPDVALERFEPGTLIIVLRVPTAS